MSAMALALTSLCLGAGGECERGDRLDVSDVSAHRTSEDVGALEVLWKREASKINDATLRDCFLQTFKGRICTQDGRLAQALMGTAKSDESVLRAEALFFLRYFDLQSVSTVVRGALADPAVQVRLAALASISYLHDRQARSQVESLALSDPNDSVRQYANKVLKSLVKPAT